MTQATSLALQLLLAVGATKPSLVLRANPLFTIGAMGTGLAEVHITAELLGPEMESHYCPDVEIEWPDSTRSSVKTECPLFEERHQCYGPLPHDEDCAPFGYPRRWSWVALMGGEWQVTVTLSKAGRVLKDGSRTVTGRVN